LIDVLIGCASTSLRLTSHRDRTRAQRLGALALTRPVANHCFGSEAFGIGSDAIRITECMSDGIWRQHAQEVAVSGGQFPTESQDLFELGRGLLGGDPTTTETADQASEARPCRCC
jgi:hypothetical protein